MLLFGYEEETVITVGTWFMIAASVFSFVVLVFVDFVAPYGRFVDRGKFWSLGLPEIPFKIGWVAMQSPNWFVSIFLFFKVAPQMGAGNYVLFAMWMIHALNVSLYFPLNTRGSRPLLAGIVLMDFVCEIANSTLQTLVATRVHTFGFGYLFSLQFILGVTIFFTGMAINVRHDRILRDLREEAGDKEYKLPRGGLFDYVSCPNYFGEFVKFTGWTIATWSLSGFTLLLVTVCNLGPRSLYNHEWNKKRFKDFPKDRKRIIPFVF